MLHGGVAYREYIATPPRKGLAEAELILGTRGRVRKLVGRNMTESKSKDDQGGYDDDGTRSEKGGTQPLRDPPREDNGVGHGSAMGAHQQTLIGGC